MAETKEQLQIETRLDTSNLKKDAQKGFNEVSNEEKKLESQTKQTSRTIDGLGTSLQNASQKGTQALRQVGNEADKTAQKVANIDKSVKTLSLGRVLGIASQLANSDFGKDIASNVGDSLGMSDDEKGLWGKGLQGGLHGAAMGGGTIASIPLALVGAAAGLLNAAKEQEKAAVALMKSAEQRQALNQERTREIDRQEAEEQQSKDFDNRFKELIASGDYARAMSLVQESRQKAQEQFDLGDKGIRNAAIQMDATPVEKRGAAYKSYDEYLNIRTSAKNRLTQLDQYEKAISTAQQNAEKQAKANERKKLQSELTGLTEERKSISEELNKQLSMGKGRISDSLTAIGGGSGYFAQNRGTVENIDRTLRIKLTSIDEDIKAIKDKMGDTGDTWN